jgi:hypothetical protein
MRVAVTDATVDQRRLLARLIQEAFPDAEILHTSGRADWVQSLAGSQNAFEVERAAIPEADIQAAALFPLENPNPVLRIARDGSVLFANHASERLLR